MHQHQLADELSFFLLLTTGLLTGLSHCMGMCGPLAGAFVLRRRSQRQEVSTPLLLFQTGRLTTYLLLGAVLGLVGGLVESRVSFQGWQGGLSVILGVLMVLMGLNLMRILPMPRSFASPALARTVSGWLKYWLSSPQPIAPFALGLVNGLLPCGAVYAVGLLAATSGDPLKGASVMLIFGLGTLPALLGIGLSAAWLSARWRSGFFQIAALLVVVVGAQLTLRGLAASGQVPHAAIGSVMLW
jgi:sulfite exporter TauE/SafE